MRKAITILSILLFVMINGQEGNVTISDTVAAQKDSLLSYSNQSAEYSFTKNQDKKNDIWGHLKYDVATMAGGFGNAFTRPLSWEK
ncbi:MAG: hypothetical protein ACOVRK_07740, partial [Chryseobacterium taeanense]